MRPHALLCIAVLYLSSFAGAATARDVSTGPVVLVASQAGTQAAGESVLLAVPLSNGAHFGFVLNRPTDTPLSTLFPAEEASRAVSSRVYSGGPVFDAAVFAIVRGSSFGQRPLHPITRELSIALETEDVDGVIAKRAGEARFFVGMMLWMPGTLAAEVKDGAWKVVPADSEVVMNRNPESLWSRLAERASYRPASLRTGSDGP